LVYPQKMIQSLSAMLKPNGKLVIATPNHSYAISKHPSFKELGDPKDWEHLQFSSDGDGHFFAYTQEELSELFRNSGLQNIVSNVFETPFISGHMKVRFLHSLLPYKLLKGLDRLLLSIPILQRYVSHQLVVTGHK